MEMYLNIYTLYIIYYTVRELGFPNFLNKYLKTHGKPRDSLVYSQAVSSGNRGGGLTPQLTHHFLNNYGKPVSSGNRGYPTRTR